MRPISPVWSRFHHDIVDIWDHFRSSFETDPADPLCVIIDTGVVCVSSLHFKPTPGSQWAQGLGGTSKG